MANQLTFLPWTIDTLSDTPIWTDYLRIDHINYVGFTSDAHVAYVTDAEGNMVALLSGDTYPTTLHGVRWVKGLTIPTTLADGMTANMESGQLLIYLK